MKAFNGIPPTGKLDGIEHGVSFCHREIPDDATAEEVLKLVNKKNPTFEVNPQEKGAGNNTTVQILSTTSHAQSNSEHHDHQHRQIDSGLLLNELVFERYRRSCFRVLLQFPLYIVSFGLLFAASWAVFGTTALSPDGGMFSIFALYTAAVLGGWIMQTISLPPLLGQLIAGIVVRNVPFISVTMPENDSIRWSSLIRMLALTVILLRAGLGLDSAALKKLKGSVLLLAVLPVFVESSCYAVLTHYLMNFPWEWGFLLGFVLSAVSPAVIVPSMLRLQEMGLGVAEGIPTLIIAASSFDDVIAIAGVGVTLSIIFSSADALLWQFLQGPAEIIGGVLYGGIVGCFLWFIPNAADPRAATFRFVLLCGFGVFAVFGSQKFGFTGAGALGCLTAAFVAALGWRQRSMHVDKSSCKQQQEVEELFVTFAAHSLAWMWSVVLQPLLFALIGAEIAFTRLDVNSLGVGLVILFLALIMRLLASVVAVSAGGGSAAARLGWKERAFVALAWIPKATVQAAVGPLAYDTARRLGRSELELALGLKVLTFAVMVILITAPLGAVAINLTGEKFLKKKKSYPDESIVLSDVPTKINQSGVPTTIDERRQADLQLDVIDTDVEAFSGLEGK